MNFFKALALAIVATVVITWALGTSLIELFNISLYVDQQVVSSWAAVSVAALVAVVVALVTAAILVSVFSLVIFLLLALFVGLAVMGLGVFWPVLLLAFIVYLLSSNRSSAAA
ncbi:hypothetical protein QWY77_13595 [Thalassotalea ponticola]|uniref:hypothetical protein n=1 Tax=Thalassotalea ponticola TaxID=1523392 RepID=UPI0025B41A79|nr:hypothetical protein [Thalassotalea ponticola]MDN3653774.1 hypothetical protein [Thalassotalea ponticola]